MKQYFYMSILALALSACQQNKADNHDQEQAVDKTEDGTTKKLPVGEAAKVSFEKLSYDFGKITQGEKVNYEFKFKNIGKSPLVITSATATCGCTVPEYPQTPIKPNEEGVIKVVFNSEGKSGKQDKVVTITSNANPEMDQLHLIGEVAEKK
jgi:hypothetical protein